MDERMTQDNIASGLGDHNLIEIDLSSSKSPKIENLNERRDERAAQELMRKNTPLADNSNEVASCSKTVISPVVAAISKFLAPVVETPKTKSRRVTTSRLITSNEFLEEMTKKEEEKKKQEAAKEEAKEKNKRKLEMAKKKELETAKKKKKAAEKKLETAKKKETKTVTENSLGKRKVSESSNDPDDPSSISSCSDSESEKRCDSEVDEDDERCGTCCRSFQKDFNREEWIKCTKSDCGTWYHLKCQKQDKYKEDFICDDCVPLLLL